MYAQLEVGSKDSKNTLSALAELLRFQLYECDVDGIPVSKEIDYLKNYFKLQSIRKENCEIEFVWEEVPGGLLIAPLLLVPFVENAFKFVSDNDEAPNFIKAGLKFDNGMLHFYCQNTAMPVASKDEGNTRKGIGLNNVLKRLKLIYNDRYSIAMGLKENVYVVNLTIKLT